MIRSIWVALNLLLVTIPLSLVIIIPSFTGGQHAVFEWVPRLWARWMLWASGVHVRLEGIDNIELGRAQVIVANHVSWFDVLAIAAFLPKRYRFIAKKELARVPLWGRAWLAAGHIAVDRGNTQAAVESLERAGRIVREDGSAIVIFPEGTRSATGELQPFKKGAVMLALLNELDIVPTAVLGTRAILPKNGWRVSAGRIIVRFGPPIPTAGRNADDREQLLAQVRAQIEHMLVAPAPVSEQ